MAARPLKQPLKPSPCPPPAAACPGCRRGETGSWRTGLGPLDRPATQGRADGRSGGLQQSGLSIARQAVTTPSLMGRQWLQAKREVANLRKGQVVGKLVKEMMVAAKLGGADVEGNPRLAAAVEKARKASVTRDVIERAIKKGAGIGADKLTLEHVVFEGYAPHKVPLIIEVLTDNNNRTAPEIRVIFKDAGQLGTPGSNKFLFDHVGLVEAHHSDLALDLEGAALEAGAQNVEPLTHAENDDIPEDRLGARFFTERADLHAVSQWLSSNGWTIVTSELGYVAKNFPKLSDEQRAEVGEFLQSLEDHDDVHRVWAALK